MFYLSPAEGLLSAVELCQPVHLEEAGVGGAKIFWLRDTVQYLAGLITRPRV